MDFRDILPSLSHKTPVDRGQAKNKGYRQAAQNEIPISKTGFLPPLIDRVYSARQKRRRVHQRAATALVRNTIRHRPMVFAKAAMDKNNLIAPDEATPGVHHHPLI